MTVAGNSSKANKIAAIILIVMAVGIAAILFVVSQSHTSSARLYFDNGLDSAVKVEIDGKEVASIAAHSAAENDTGVGKHAVKVTDDKGKAVETVDIEIPAAQGIANHRFAFNIGKQNHYVTTSIGYGNAKTDGKTSAIGEGQQFFELTNPDALFLPVDNVSEKGRAGSVIALVMHKPLHEKFPCCANTRALLSKSEQPAK